MEVYKFGGASVKDAHSVKNAASILSHASETSNYLVVISAMGKTTNHLEQVVDAYLSSSSSLPSLLKDLEENHHSICKDLFPEKHPVFEKLNNLFAELQWNLEEQPEQDRDYVYDQVVSYGELFSTLIFCEYLNHQGLPAIWIDARDFIKTDETYREGKVDWEETQKQVTTYFTNKQDRIWITQGFIGSTSQNTTTTLGREGSDYSAAIFAYCLGAEKVTIWKDVPGVLNADPRYFSEAIVLPHLSYQDTIELAYYGASVIHPKTLKPLQNKGIPFFVKSFTHPDLPGTTIDDKADIMHQPCFILKKNQVLLSLFPRDFSFIVEDNLSEIYRLLSECRVKVNVMQNSALSLTICSDDSPSLFQQLIPTLSQKYKTLYNRDLELITIRYYNRESIESINPRGEILLEQRSRHTFQAVIRAHAKNQ
jgi:aspartate kinase